MAYRDMQYDRKTAKVARYYDAIKNDERETPVSLQVALCDACFNRCIMCDHPKRDPKQMEVRRWMAWLYWFAQHGVESVCYSGGDPMAYSDFNLVMEQHSKSGVLFGMTITGYVPPTIDLSLLAEASWVRVSLDAITPEVYERCRGKIPVRKVLESIERMKTASVKVGLGITVHAGNQDDLPNVLNYAADMGITDVEVHHIVPDSPDRATKAIQWHRRIEPFSKCHATLYQLYIDASGDVYPCCITAGDSHAQPQAAPLGNIFSSLAYWEPIWDAAKAYANRPYADLPHICHTTCIQRLSQINRIVDEIDAGAGGSSFF